jgi:alanyl-tRNA synthetase
MRKAEKRKRKKRVKAIKMLLFYKKLEKNMLLIFGGKYQRRIRVVKCEGGDFLALNKKVV